MVNLYKLKLTTLQQEILRLLFVKAGASLNQRRIAALLGVSDPAVRKALPGLRGLISMEQDKQSRRWSVSLNRENRNVLHLKRADNLRLIYESGLADALESECAGAGVVLFGSYAVGEDTLRSDIDIAVIGRKEKHLELARFERSLERTIAVNFYDSLASIHKDLRESIINGIVLAGGLEL